MRKEEYIKRYGEEAYQKYLKKQAELTKQWRKEHKEKAREYGRRYYCRLKSLAKVALEMMASEDQDQDKA